MSISKPLQEVFSGADEFDRLVYRRRNRIEEIKTARTGDEHSGGAIVSHSWCEASTPSEDSNGNFQRVTAIIAVDKLRGLRNLRAAVMLVTNKPAWRSENFL